MGFFNRLFGIPMPLLTLDELKIKYGNRMRSIPQDQRSGAYWNALVLLNKNLEKGVEYAKNQAWYEERFAGGRIVDPFTVPRERSEQMLANIPHQWAVRLWQEFLVDTGEYQSIPGYANKDIKKE